MTTWAMLFYDRQYPARHRSLIINRLPFSASWFEAALGVLERFNGGEGEVVDGAFGGLVGEEAGEGG